MRVIVTYGIVISVLLVSTVAQGPDSVARANGVGPTNAGCDNAKPIPVLQYNIGDAGLLVFPFAPPSGKPSPAPTPPPSEFPVLPAGAKIVVKGQTVQEATTGTVAAYSAILPVGGELWVAGKVVQRATPDTGPMLIRIPAPAPSSPATDVPAGNTVGAPPAASMQFARPQAFDGRVITISATPLPLPSPSGSPAAAPPPQKTQTFAISARDAGQTVVMIGDGQHACEYAVRVSPGRSTSKLVFTTGIGGSNIPVTSVTSVAPPSPAPVPAGQFVYFTERSNGQTFLPILANYRVTDLPWGLQGYLSGGLATSGSAGKTLFGLSLGTDNYLLTVGWHSTTVDTLQPGLIPNQFNVMPAGAPLTFASRTTRPFVSITFPVCAVTGIFSGSGTSQTCATPSPKPTASAAPSGG